MAAFLSLFIVISAIVYPTHQLTQPEACKVALNPFIRTKCGSAGVTREACLSMNCCFVQSEASKQACASSTTKSSGTCYYPANCEAGEPLSRLQCGWAGISQAKCHCKGCCYDPSATSTKCFHAYSASTGCTWEEHDNEVVVFNNDREFKQSMTLKQCKEACQDETGFQCNSFEYHKVMARCFLSTLTYLEAKKTGLVRQSSEFTMYSCPSRAPAVLPDCVGKKLDVLFVLDESSSILPGDFTQVKKFATGISKHVHMTAEETHVGLVTFSTSPNYRFKLHQGTNAGKTIHMIKSVTQAGGSTQTHSAIESILKFVSGAYGGRADGIKVAIIQTDGKSFNETLTKEAAQIVRANSIKLIVFGVGEFNEDELKNIASHPVEDHIFKVANYHQLDAIVESIVKLACSGVAPEPLPPKAPTPPNPLDVPPFCKDIPVANRTEDPPLYMIDPDGPNFGADRFRVTCDFTADPPVTVVHNSQEAGSCAKDCKEVDSGCFNQEIDYLGSWFQVSQMTKFADSCSQYMKFDCHGAALDYRTHNSKGPFTFWTNNKGDHMNYWPGGAATGGCACGKSGACAISGEKCNCDARDNTWRIDDGTITDRHLLPVKEVRIGDIQNEGQQGCFTMGPLLCI